MGCSLRSRDGEEEEGSGQESESRAKRKRKMVVGGSGRELEGGSRGCSRIGEKVEEAGRGSGWKAAVRLLLRGLKATDEEMTAVGGEEEGRTEVAGGSPLSRMMLPASFLLFHYLSFLLAVAKMVR
ncbi:hypothetical protein BHE74_00016563 [Ensete ventricosum]|nr:hypothetical protein BHE74_00016563 [Ensete ventricosum]RZS03665.1 hypothetical protein BHM03_00033865 [Ensete ventricosum]